MAWEDISRYKLVSPTQTDLQTTIGNVCTSVLYSYRCTSERYEYPLSYDTRSLPPPFSPQSFFSTSTPSCMDLPITLFSTDFMIHSFTIQLSPLLFPTKPFSLFARCLLQIQVQGQDRWDGSSRTKHVVHQRSPHGQEEGDSSVLLHGHCPLWL